jgi:hypothetical protein
MWKAESAATTSLSLRSAGPDVNPATCTCHSEYTEGACEQGTSSREHFRRHEGRGERGSIADSRVNGKYVAVASLCRAGRQADYVYMSL